MTSKRKDYFIAGLSWLVAAVFIFAGIGKIVNPTNFAIDIDNYRMLPYILVTFVAIVLPWLEVLCGLFIIFGKWRTGAALILLTLSFFFFIAIGSAMIRGLDISCGCFVASKAATRIGFIKLFENIVLLALTVVIYVNVFNRSSN